VEAKNRFAVGDRLEIIHPAGNHTVTLDAMRNQDGEAITVAQGSPIRVWVPLAAPVEGALIARLS
jgi:putative protease